jgi:1,6-anhydro-N-acetylmuramate kinase
MFTLFEVFLVPGPQAEGMKILSDEVLELTQAQVMTPEQAEAVGFHGIPEDPEGRKRVFIACAPTHARLIHSRLESSAVVGAFRLHDVG